MTDNHSESTKSQDETIDATQGAKGSSSEHPGAQIDHYHLLEKIGEGGFGAVWAAEQRHPVKRRVALKIIKEGMDTKQVIARFEIERQALAMMDHPNIAKILGAGSTDSGRPYFCMELVKGIPITQFAHEQRLKLDERLKLFIKICRAIQHAHQKGIIHRDIKPSNILVSIHDNQATPKVIDFGIAKATHQNLTDKTLHTRLHQFMGTPTYMSPEQASMSGLDIDTRSDIYSLGVLLYELVTSVTPFDAKELSVFDFESLRKMIREVDPPRPSARIQRLGNTNTTNHALGTDLVPRLRGDLDWIIMKALEKDRIRRYETANDLAQDLERHLDHSPVQARPPSTAYLFLKAWTRNKPIFITATIVAGAILMAALISTWFAFNEHEARVAETKERERATAAEQIAENAADLNRRLSYFSDVNLAHQIYLTGDLARASKLLNRHLPEETSEDLRGFEWHYLQDVCLGLSVPSVSHVGIADIAYSPTQRTFATAGSDGHIKIWNRDTLNLNRSHPLSPSPDKYYRRIELAYSPTGRFLVGLSRLHYSDSSGKVDILDTATGDSWPLEGEKSENIVQIGFRQDDDTLVTASEQGIVKEWNTSNGKLLHQTTLPSKPEKWHRAAFSKDISLVAGVLSASSPTEPSPSQTIHIYHLESKTIRQSIENGNTILDKYEFSNDARLLAGAGESQGDIGGFLVWQVSTGEQVFASSASDMFWGIAPIGSTEFIVGGLNSIIFAVPEQGIIRDQWSQIPGLVSELAVAPDQQEIASSGWDGITRLWTVPRPENPRSIPMERRIEGPVSYSPLNDALIIPTARGVTIFDATTLKERHHLATQQKPLSAPNGDTLLTVSSSGQSIRFWSLQSGTELRSPLTIEQERIESFAISRDETLLGYSSSNKAITICDLTQPLPRNLKTISNHSNHSPQNYLAFGIGVDRSNLLAIPADNKSVKLINLSNDEEHLLEINMGETWGVTFSPDGRYLATRGQNVHVWDTTSLEPILVIDETTTAVIQTEFSPDQKSLLCVGWDESVGLWDLSSGRERIRLSHSSTQKVQSACFATDGSRIIAAVNNDSLRIWSAPGLTHGSGPPN